MVGHMRAMVIGKTRGKTQLRKGVTQMSGKVARVRVGVWAAEAGVGVRNGERVPQNGLRLAVAKWVVFVIAG